MFQKSIILFSVLSGSIYLNAVSLVELNKLNMKDKDEVKYNIYPSIIINSIVFMSSTIIIGLCSSKALQILLD
jgi:hypothetical protein